MRDGWYLDEVGTLRMQKMHTIEYDDDGDEYKKPKGLKQVLQERKLWKEGMVKQGCTY